MFTISHSSNYSIYLLIFYFIFKTKFWFFFWITHCGFWIAFFSFSSITHVHVAGHWNRCSKDSKTYIETPSWSNDCGVFLVRFSNDVFQRSFNFNPINEYGRRTMKRYYYNRNDGTLIRGIVSNSSLSVLYFISVYCRR